MTIPAFAGSFEDALNSSDNVFLYIYTPSCGYCKRFEPNYNKLVSAFGNKCKFVKLNGAEQYGGTIAYQYKASYVPYVVLIKTKTKTGTVIPADCLLKYSCVSQKVSDFIK